MEQGYKYSISTTPESNGYKATMQLNITRINNHDLAMYFCIAKNARGITKGAFTLYGKFCFRKAYVC